MLQEESQRGISCVNSDDRFAQSDPSGLRDNLIQGRQVKKKSVYVVDKQFANQ